MAMGTRRTRVQRTSQNRGGEQDRGSPQWLARVTTDGRWDIPDRWSDPTDRTAALQRAVAAARSVFTPSTTKRLFQHRQLALVQSRWIDPGRAYLVQLLTDPFAAWMSPLLHLGADLVDAGTIPARLIKRLRDPQQHRDAAFELELFARFRRAVLSVDFEPRGTRVDFVVRDPSTGTPVSIDAKNPTSGADQRESMSWLECVNDALLRVRGARISAEPTDYLCTRQSDDVGRSWIRANIRTIAERARTEATKAALAGSLPTDVDVADEAGMALLRLHVSASGQSVVQWCPEAPDASRIIRSALETAGSQFGDAEYGVVVVHVPLQHSR